ncbi:unnamed protein product [Blepharisma stoltei]|uniref:Uncharacterized protein n=1 Tax=Blepharisma stoltei TaxID=1481888 RepID=A0AAU9JVE7_9CILI|nr:unnamed protein product [Blepharisma stoltei]
MALKEFLFLLIIPATFAIGYDDLGSIVPSGHLPISLSINNADEIADYSFSFTADHTVPSGGTIVVTFPSQYTSGFTTSPTCNLGSCSVSSQSVTTTLSKILESNTFSILTISGITNPSSPGGVGNFQIQTFYGANMIDSNSAFGVIGIENLIGSMISSGVSVASGEDAKAGVSTKYEFKFKLNRPLGAWNWIRFTFPNNGYTFDAYPTCSSYSINGNIVEGSLWCVNNGNQVQLTGIAADLQADFDYGVRVVVTNPSYTIASTGTFTIETGHNLTNSIYDRSSGISGIPIKPGLITQISLQPQEAWNLTTSKTIVYRLKFMPSNPIEVGGQILIIGSSSFNMNGLGIYQLEYGLSDLSTSQALSFSYSSSSYTLSITNFAEYSKPALISLLLQFTNPSVSGLTSPLIIRTLKADGNTVIDENISDATVEISTLSSPLSVSVSYPGSSTNQATGAFTDIRISISPQLEIPASGWIQVTLPSGFSINSLVAPICKVKPTYMTAATAQSCFVVGSKIAVQLFADSAGVYGKFQAGVSSYFEISNIYAPKSSGWFIFDFGTYDNNFGFLESGSATVNMVAYVQSTIAVTAVHTGLDTPTVIIFSWTAQEDVASGVASSSPYNAQGFVEIKFPSMSGGNNLFRTDLGLGVSVGASVPCLGVSGILPASGSSLSCIITTLPSSASSSTPAIITISNFLAISKTSSIIIHFPGIKYVQTTNSPTYTITTYQVTNRIRADLDTGTYTGSAGTSPPSSTTSGVTMTLSSFTVQSTSTLASGSAFTTSSATGSTLPYLLFQITPTHDLGYCQYATVSCTIDGAAKTCLCYPGIDMIMVTLTASLAAGTHTYSIAGLYNPESVPTTQDDLVLYTCGNQAMVESFTFTGKIPTLTPGGFMNPNVEPTSYGQGYVFVQYTFTFSPVHAIPAGGSAQVIFPSSYSLSSSSPSPYCSTVFLSILDQSGSTCTVTSNTITISIPQTLYSQNIIYIKVRGVKNPSASSSGTFTFKTKNSSGRTIDMDSTIPGITFTTAYSTKSITDLGLYLYPSSANATAIYAFEFQASEYLGAGGTIQIVFPLTQFGILKTPPICRITNSISRYSSCSATASTVTIVTGTDPISGKVLISILNIRNFDQGQSSEFMVTTSYDGVTLQQTPSSTYFATTTAQSPSLTVTSIVFFPKNEGELATYQFYFTPKYDIEEDESIVITFPFQFDHDLGENFYCWATGMTGYLECYLIRSYNLIVSKHDAFKACSSCQIVLYTYGIKNPNYSGSATDSIKIGILSGSSYKEYNEYAGTITTVAAPKYNNLMNTTTDNLYARYTGTFFFNFTTTSSIPVSSNGGEIWVKFPSDYVLMDSNFHCRSTNSWADGLPNCTLQYDTIRVKGQTAQYKGNLGLYIDNVPHPLQEGFAGFIDVEIYDGFNYIILDRSYPNLNPNRFNYSYPGPLLHVNGDENFVVRRGCMSEFITITLDYPCGLNLTLVPASNKFNFYPPNIYINTGDTSASFRVSIPSDTEDTEYAISWTTTGDYTPPFYSQILVSTFNVSKDISVAITPEEIMPIPLGGSSFPIKIVLQSAPDSDITIQLTIDSSITGITLSANSLTYKAEVYDQNFTISVSSTVTVKNCTVHYSVSGTNADSYSFTANSQTFEIFNDTETLEILSVSPINNTRATATIRISTTKVCTCYYQYSLKGTTNPSLSDVVDKITPLSTTRTIYGSVRIFSSLSEEIVITGLTAQTYYTIYVWGIDLLGNSTETSTNADFTTYDRYKAAEISLQFGQSYVNSVEISTIAAEISLLLSIHPWRVLNVPVPEVENLSSTSVTFYIMDKPDSDAYPEPIDMVPILSAAKGKLSSSLNNFNAAQTITGTELVIKECAFSTYPYVLNSSDYKSISFSAALENDGYIYSILELTNTSKKVPYSFQVFNGNNYANKPAMSIKAQATAGVAVNSTYSSLSQYTQYTLNVICTNTYPIFPDVAYDSGVATIIHITPKKPNPTPLNINSAAILPLLAFLLFIF